MYVMLSTFLLLYYTLSKNIYSTKVYTCEGKLFIYDSCVERFFTTSDAYVSTCTFVYNIHISNITGVDLSYILFI